MNQDQLRIFLKRLEEAYDTTDRELRNKRDEYHPADELAKAVQSGAVKMASIGAIRTLLSKPDTLEIHSDDGKMSVHFRNYRVAADDFFDKSSLGKVKIRVRREEAAHVQQYQNLRDGLKEAHQKGQITILDKSCTPEEAEQLVGKIKDFGKK